MSKQQGSNEDLTGVQASLAGKQSPVGVRGSSSGPTPYPHCGAVSTFPTSSKNSLWILNTILLLVLLMTEQPQNAVAIKTA